MEKKHLDVTLAGTLYHMCKVWAILPESNMVDPIEVRWNGREMGGVHQENHDEPRRYSNGRHI
jgi:hypothetical protein